MKASTNKSSRAFAAFEWLIASRYLRARRSEGVISVIAGFSFLGIMLGVATLIIVMAVMNGFRKELFDKILGVNGHVLIQPIDAPLNDYLDLVTQLQKVKHVTHVIPFVEGQAFISGLGQGSGVLVRGVRDEDLNSIPAISSNIRSGSLINFSANGGIAIGKRLANSLGVQIGDSIKILSPNGPHTPFGQTPRSKIYLVSAVFEIGMSELDSLVVFMPLQEAQTFFNQEGRVTAIELYLDNPDRIGEVRDELNKALNRQLYFTDWRQRNATFFNALEVERNVMFLILTLIVLVAALNIISGLTMLVKDKSHDIAILRTMGANRGVILRVFFITGASIGVCGTFAGLILGTLICNNIDGIKNLISKLTGTDLFSPELYFLAHLPAEMNVSEVTAVVFMALTLSFLATLYPAWRAAKLDPVEALRYE
jgi:lipoprotein-releasing system permease protein